MGYNSWGNLFAPERRRALGPTFIETFPSSLRFREQKLCFPTMRLDTLCLLMEKRFLRFPAISFRRSIGDESHGRVSWGKLYVRGAVVISRALLLRGPASSGWNVQAGVSSLRFVVICWNDNWRSEKHSRARCVIG